MTDDKKKHDDKDRKKLSDEELEDVAGGNLDVDRRGGHIDDKTRHTKKKPRPGTSSFGQDTDGDTW
ncbi:MAG: hypothetical protein P8K66_06020 [Planctomycetota bacterium]|nr:hypothetical protein [Planctomycetota bacterium]